LRFALARASGFALARTLGLALALALAAAAVQATPIEVRDDRGHVVKLPAPALRIVSLLPSLTEAVCAVGGCARLVGVDRWSNHPAEVAALPRLGGLDDAQVERIVALAPDVVLLSTSARVKSRLEALGLRLVVLDSQTHADVQRSLDVIAALLGRPHEGARQWAAVQRELEAAAAGVPAGWRGRRAYFEVSSTPHAAGAASYLGQTLARLGLVNIVPASMGPFPQLAPEFVVRGAPEVLLGPAREVSGFGARPGWSAIEAVREGRVCAFDAAAYELLVRPGPRIGEGARLVADCLARAAPPKAAP
jgi:iron complex transport system substrate-binding protein